MKNLNKAILIALGMILPLSVMASPDDDVTIRMMEANEHASESVTSHIELPEAADDHAIEHATNGLDTANNDHSGDLEKDREHEVDRDDDREDEHERDLDLDREEDHERDVETERDDRKDIEHEGIDREEVEREGDENIDHSEGFEGVDHDSENAQQEIDAPEQDFEAPGNDDSGSDDHEDGDQPPHVH